MRFDLTDKCPISDLLDSDGRFVVAMCVAISILADKSREPELVEALEDALSTWSLNKGYTTL